jgi:hypothetical protein
MVVFYLRNSLAPDDKIVPITIALTSEVVVSQIAPSRLDQISQAEIDELVASGIPLPSNQDFPNLADTEGDNIWLLLVAPPRNELDKDTGQPIPPEIINIVTEGTLHEEIEAAMGRIGERVEWPALHSDIQPPKLINIDPPNNATGVNIFSDIIYRITEPLPAAGLDLSTLHMTLNDLPVIVSGVAVPGEVVEFRGNIFDLQIIHRPKRSFN